jgi:hypothetical protein
MSSFQKPCIVDLKMGRQTYEPDAPLEKKNKEVHIHQVL